MISAETWQRAEEWFHRALMLEGDSREQLLESLRAQHVEVHALVTEMLAEAERLDLSDINEAGRDQGTRESEPPSRIDEYEIVREIGRGGMGVVYEAVQPRLDRRVALKWLRGSGTGASDHGRTQRFVRDARRFHEEARVLGLLDHPGVVPILDFVESNSGPTFLTMRMVVGDDFREGLRKTRERVDGWSSTRALVVLQRVCETVAFAHHRGVCHRDIKPSNVMTGPFGEVYVIDWGLARVIDRPRELCTTRVESTALTTDEDLLTVDGDVIGTPAYMAPEQALGSIDQVGPRSDVYSIGAVLYELLAGHPPHWVDGERNDTLAILERARRGPPPRLLPRRGAEPVLAAICDKAMAQDPLERYASAEALGSDLSAYLSNRVVRAYESGAFAELRMWCVRNRVLATTILLALGIITFASTRVALLNSELREERDDFFRVATAHDLEVAEQSLDALWPLDDSQIEPLREWLRNAERLTADLTLHRAQLEAIRARALPWSDADRSRDRLTHPDLPRLLLLEEEIEAIPAKIAFVSKTLVENPISEAEILNNQAIKGGIDSLTHKLERNNKELAALRLRVESRRTWRFESREDAWWQEQLALLVSDLESFADPETGAIDGLSRTHGMGARRRLEFAQSVAKRTLESAEARAAWNEAIAIVSNPACCPMYSGLKLEPQLGLLPLGLDPQSGLFEFWHPLTGDPPRRDDRGRLVITESSSLVFVLIPPGRFPLGAQSSDPSGLNFDPDADRRGDEGYSDGGGIREVGVAPFLLSKYELTSAIWLRVAGSDPSVLAGYSNGAETVNGRHPVENVPFDLAVEWMKRLDLGLPSEIQWEYACRAGTRTPRWWDEQRVDPAGQSNLADCQFRGADLAGSTIQVADWDDGFALHAPVGSLPPNAFGIHECLGNVLEWCSNRYSKAGYTVEGREPLHRHTPLTPVSRGGCYASPVRDVRASNRFPIDHELLRYQGLRPCRELRSLGNGSQR